ncbi:MAG: HAD family hydrolase [Ignavibacteriae bacterium]|nr:HAD family hydrolase [Ignavibacteria bacterium]MBI3364584.1 HAD family hydrolase [Ignavibacteriota bacterium]
MNAVLFDFGGTIDTDGVHWSEKFWEYYERFKLPVAKKDFARVFVRSEEELGEDSSLSSATFYATLVKQFTLQFAILGFSERHEVLMRIINACYADVGKTIAGARNLLNDLHGAYKLGLVSNFYGNLEIVCKEFSLDRYFDTMIDSVVVGIRKPDPAIFQLALDRLAIAAQEAYVVGDSYERDIVPGKQLGCTTIWLKGKSWTAHPTETPATDFSIEHFEEIRKILF